MIEHLFIETIEDSVLKASPKLILEGLFSRDILTDMPNKVRFYSFYKKSINCLHSNAKGTIYLKRSIKRGIQNKKEQYLEFYDTCFLNPRFTMIIQEENKKLTVSTLPF